MKAKPDGWTFLKFEPRAWRIVVIYVVLSLLWIYFSDRILVAIVKDEAALLTWSVYKGFGFVIFTALMMLLMFQRDLTQLRKNEKEIEGLNRLLVARSKVNQALVHDANLDDFLNEVCRILVDHGQVDMACIGRIEPVSGQIHQVASSREGELLFPTLEGTVRTFVTNNLAGDELMAPWSEAVRKKGFKAAAFLPIQHREVAWGVLSVYSRAPGFFHAREVSLLEEVGADVSFALDVVSRTKARDEAKNQVRNEKDFSEAILESLPGIVYFYEEDGGFLRWNRNFEVVSGYTAKELRGLRPLEVIHPGDRALVRSCISDVFEHGSSSIEARLLCKDGAAIAHFFTGKRLEFNGKACLAGVGLDVSELDEMASELRALNMTLEKRVSELRESESRFRLLAENIEEVFWISDVEKGTMHYVSPAYETIWGRPCEALIANAKTWMDSIHPDDRARVSSAVQTEQEKGEYDEIYRIIRPDGEVRWIRDRAFPVTNENGVVYRIVGTATDVTEQKLGAERIAEQAALLDKSHDAILVSDLDHRVLYWNRSAEQLYGWTFQDAEGSLLPELIYRERDAFDEALEATLDQGEWTGEIVQVSKSGQDIIVESRWTLVRDDDDTPRSILSINTNITERKRLESQFLRTQRMESIGTLAGGISHDLNNLLSPIVMGVDLLRQGITDPRLVGIVENIGKSAERGRSLVKQVLSFARGVDGSRVTFLMDSIVREVESIIETSFPKNIRVVHKSDSRLWPIVGDPTQFNQVLLNLAVNARDAMPSGGQIKITTRNMDIDEQFAVMNRELTAGRYVVLEVRDEGTGMPPDVIDRLFEPFFTTKPQGEGTGLGLPTVLAIVHSHGGTITVYSQIGRGSVFRVYIPAQVDTLQEAEAREEAELAAGEGDNQRGDQDNTHRGFDGHQGDSDSQSGGPGGRQGEEKASQSGALQELPRGNGELILVVDDEPSIVSITRQTLEAYGYRVLTAEDGAQAIGLYADNRADVKLVLTDMMMPIMDGPSLVKALRRMDPDVRVIGTSGLQSDGDTSETYGLGFQRFIEKPYSAGRLLTMVAAVLRE